MRSFLIFFICFFSLVLEGQQENEQYNDRVFLDNISTVFFDFNYSLGLDWGSTPVIKGGERLHLSFDDMDGDDKEYIYRIYHCTKDWTKTDINELEFTDGLNEYIIEDYEFDNALYSDYTSYNLSFPNDDVNLLLSGNYVIEIYDNSGEDEVLAITKRFILVEDRVTVEMEQKPIQAINYLHNQEISFNINYKHFPMVDPADEVSVSIYQNGNWSTGLENIKSEYIFGTILKFGSTKPIVFPGLKEYRTFDIRSLRFTSEYVEAIDRHDQGTDVLLKMDKKRYQYFTNDDLNGSYFISNGNSPESPEYANVIFNLKSNVIYDEDIYVFGKLSQFGLSNKHKMRYDDERSLYIAEVNLKQGVYDYMYAMEKEGEVDLQSLEGTSSETNNVYTFIVYYSTINEDYDRAIGVANYIPNYGN